MRPCHLPLQSVIARPPDPSTVHRLAPHRGMLHSRQASNNSNQQSSLDDSGVVDDHDGDDVTSAEEHEKRESREHRAERCSPREHGTLRVQTVQPRPADYPPAPVTISVKTGNREIRVLKCNGVKTKKHMYALPPEYLSHIVVLGEPFSIVPALLSTTVSRDGHPRDSPPPPRVVPLGSSRPRSEIGDSAGDQLGPFAGRFRCSSSVVSTCVGAHARTQITKQASRVVH